MGVVGVHGMPGVTSLQWVGRTGFILTRSVTPMAPPMLSSLKPDPCWANPL